MINSTMNRRQVLEVLGVLPAVEDDELVLLVGDEEAGGEGEVERLEARGVAVGEDNGRYSCLISSSCGVGTPLCCFPVLCVCG